MSEQKLTLKETIEATKSVTDQLYEDHETTSDTIERNIKPTLASLAKEFFKFKRLHNAMLIEIKKEISEEVRKQNEPFVKQLNDIEETLNQILLNKPKAIYILPKLPNPFRWFFRIVTGTIKKRG